LNKKKIILLSLIFVCVAGVVIIPLIVMNTINVPKFVEKDWIELDKIYQIGKFHSTLGHGYPDENSQYSDKHYYTPLFNYMNSKTSVKIFSPVDGVVTGIFDETTRGKQIHIKSSQYSSIIFKLFHINIEGFDLKTGYAVSAGQHIGYADLTGGGGTDIAITKQGKEISWFQIISDSLFSQYQQRGIKSREMMIKTEEQAQKSIQLGFSFSSSDPADEITLKNTKYPQIIGTNFINISKIDKVSYFPNNLNNTCHMGNYYNVSNAIFFELNKSDPYTNTNGYNTEIKAPFNAKLKLKTCSVNIHYIELVYQNSSFNNLTMEDFTLNVDFYGIELEVGVISDSNVSEGQVIGRAKEYFGVKVESCDNTHQFIPIFGLMNDDAFNAWNQRGIENKTSLVLNFEEYLAKIDQCGTSQFNFEINNIWWINLN